MKKILPLLATIILLSASSCAKAQGDLIDFKYYLLEPFPQSTSLLFSMPAALGVSQFKLAKSDTVNNRLIDYRFLLPDAQPFRISFQNTVSDEGEQLVDHILIESKFDVCYTLITNLYGSLIGKEKLRKQEDLLIKRATYNVLFTKAEARSTSDTEDRWYIQIRPLESRRK